MSAFNKEIKPQFFKYLAPAVTGPQATEGGLEPDLCGYGVHSLNHYGTQSSKKKGQVESKLNLCF